MKDQASPTGQPRGLDRRVRLMLASSLLASGWGWAAPQEESSEPAGPETAPTEEESSEEPAEEEEEPLLYFNWIKVGLGGTWVDGPRSAFEQRRHLPGDALYGGIEEAHYENFVGDAGFFKADAKALFEKHEYDVSVDYEVLDVGFVRAGYRQARFWSDGVGGYLPNNGVWIPLQDRDLHLDRGEAWFEAGLTLPSWPRIKLRYTHRFRDGEKASTIWGQAFTPSGIRGVVGAFYDLDEQRDTLELEASHTLDKTDLGLGLRYEISDLDNSLNYRRFPNNPLQNFVTQEDKTESDLFNVHAHSTTRLNDELRFSSAYAFTTLDTDLGGSRIFGANYGSAYDPALARGPGFLRLAGGSQLRQHVANFNVFWQAVEHLAVIPSIRLERTDTDGQSAWLDTPSLDLKAADHERGIWEVAEEIEARYDGIKNWLFYTSGEWSQGRGDLEERQIARATGVVELDRETDDDRLTQKYTAGANWYPLGNLTLGAQYYYKIRENDYDHDTDSTANGAGSFNRYPAFLRNQDFQTHDANVRASWRPLSKVTLVSRYDYQISTVDTKADGFSELETAELTSHIFSQDITWTPIHWLYLQAGLNYVLNETITPASEDALPDRLVRDAENDYWIGTFSTGLAIGQKTDLQATYFYSRADNYVDNSDVTVPYGAGFEEHGVTASLSREIRRGLVGTLSYGWFKARDQATGGNTDFEGHLVYSSLVYRF